jgi:hypothetical protein
MNYWSDVFTEESWQQFCEAGGKVSGFPDSVRTSLQQVEPGDYFLCYAMKLKTYFAVLKVTSKAFRDETPIWTGDAYPCRIEVEVVSDLGPKKGVPVSELIKNLSWSHKTADSWGARFQRSLVREKSADGQKIVQAINAQVEQLFSSPIVDDIPLLEDTAPTHAGIQYSLLRLGNQLGCGLWVARSDKSASHEGQFFKDEFNLLSGLPFTLKDARAQDVIEQIDVLWVKDNAIVAAFEIEHTTSIYSGLLRLADLITLLPTFNTPLFIVAPDERSDKVRAQINRPVFSKALQPPLFQKCRYIPYSKLNEKVSVPEKYLLHMPVHVVLDEIGESIEPEIR